MAHAPFDPGDDTLPTGAALVPTPGKPYGCLLRHVPPGGSSCLCAGSCGSDGGVGPLSPPSDDDDSHDHVPIREPASRLRRGCGRHSAVGRGAWAGRRALVTLSGRGLPAPTRRFFSKSVSQVPGGVLDLVA